MPYDFHFDYDGGGEFDNDGEWQDADSPHIYITGPDGGDYLEVLEEAIATVEQPDCNDEHWRLGDNSIVPKLLTFLNELESQGWTP